MAIRTIQAHRRQPFGTCLRCNQRPRTGRRGCSDRLIGAAGTGWPKLQDDLRDAGNARTSLAELTCP